MNSIVLFASENTKIASVGGIKRRLRKMTIQPSLKLENGQFSRPFLWKRIKTVIIL